MYIRTKRVSLHLVFACSVQYYFVAMSFLCVFGVGEHVVYTLVSCS